MVEFIKTSLTSGETAQVASYVQGHPTVSSLSLKGTFVTRSQSSPDLQTDEKLFKPRTRNLCSQELWDEVDAL